MPSIEKAARRERLRRKAKDSKFQGVRYQTLRAGQSLAVFEVERKTKPTGKLAKGKSKKQP